MLVCDNFCKVFGIWYLKYQIRNKQQYFEAVFKYQNEHRYLAFYLNTLVRVFVTTLIPSDSREHSLTFSLCYTDGEYMHNITKLESVAKPSVMVALRCFTARHRTFVANMRKVRYHGNRSSLGPV